MNEKNTCCFFGHRKIVIKEYLIKSLRNEIEKLISEKKGLCITNPQKCGNTQNFRF